MDRRFCKICGRKIDNFFFFGERIVEFEDGSYCETCARLRIDKRRINFK